MKPTGFASLLLLSVLVSVGVHAGGDVPKPAEEVDMEEMARRARLYTHGKA